MVACPSPGCSIEPTKSKTLRREAVKGGWSGGVGKYTCQEDPILLNLGNEIHIEMTVVAINDK